MHVPILMVTLALTAAFPASAEPPALELRGSALETRRDDGEFSLRATWHRAQAPSALHENAQFSLLGTVQSRGVDCSDVIFRNGFETP